MNPVIEIFEDRTYEIWSRGGSKSPSLSLAIINGRKVTPFERKVRGPKEDMTDLIVTHYRPSRIREMIVPKESIFLNLVSSGASKGSVINLNDIGKQ